MHTQLSSNRGALTGILHQQNAWIKVTRKRKQSTIEQEPPTSPSV